MKKTITAILILVSFNLQAQDTTQVKSLQLMARMIEYLIPVCMNTDNDSLFQVYIDLRPTFRVKNPPTGNTLVTIDSIPTVELAKLYNYTLSNNDGLGYGNQMKTAIAPARATNSYLNTLCTGYEAYWSERLNSLRASGRRILKGK